MGSVGVASWLVGFASSPLCGGLVMIVPYPFFLTQWLKSSVERLSGNSERAPLQGLTSLRNRTKGHHFGRFALPKTRDPTRAASFQTVSIRRILGSSRQILALLGA